MRATFSTIAAVTTALLLAGAALLALFFARIWIRLPLDPQTVQQPALALSEPAPAPDAESWQVVRLSTRPPQASGPLDERFRLAGTFFLYGDESPEGEASARRRAILDDLAAKQQMLVQEEQEIDGYVITRIESDRMLLRRDGTDYEIKLSFSALAGAATAKSADANETPVSMEDMPALESSRFGKRVGENRWVMRREELLRYYAELLDDPERIANVYASMKPAYEGNDITGYNVDIEGEAEFFKAIGLQEGDVVRRVNSMRMVSQRRAEYFISEFMKDRVSALVFDVERGEKEEKLIYLIR
ncbi:MAG TPA: hypothetical protein PKE12_08750 [Kiritimatiellia bacterium]|nr:hypothetical protein [Kiritimatiellia bacterium]